MQTFCKHCDFSTQMKTKQACRLNWFLFRGDSPPVGGTSLLFRESVESARRPMKTRRKHSHIVDRGIFSPSRDFKVNPKEHFSKL